MNKSADTTLQIEPQGLQKIEESDKAKKKIHLNNLKT